MSTTCLLVDLPHSSLAPLLFNLTIQADTHTSVVPNERSVVLLRECLRENCEARIAFLRRLRQCIIDRQRNPLQELSLQRLLLLLLKILSRHSALRVQSWSRFRIRRMGAFYAAAQGTSSIDQWRTVKRRLFIV